MADLVCYLPNHGYTDGNDIYVSWLDTIYDVAQKTTNTFKLADVSTAAIVQFSTSITDGYVRIDSAAGASTTITGLTHLIGEQVWAVSGGVFLGTFLVDGSGEITVLASVTNSAVGIPYAAKIRTMRLEIPAAPTIQSRIKRINETVVRAIRTQEGTAGQEYNGKEYLSTLDFTYSNESEDQKIMPEGGFTEDAYTVVRSDTPFPSTILATIVSFEVEEQR